MQRLLWVVAFNYCTIYSIFLQAIKKKHSKISFNLLAMVSRHKSEVTCYVYCCSIGLLFFPLLGSYQFKEGLVSKEPALCRYEVKRENLVYQAS